ncbi:MAG: hypothetical protein NWF07_16985 [Candidatus Bathyarchaeota archaeon]|nr:hypothetical protein [Candidatus Bathyarchaeota archaeon]
MRSFEDISTTIRETTLVVSASLTFIFLFWAAVVVRSVIQRGNLLNPLFLSGLVLFGFLGFFMLEIAGRFGFIGGGLKFGAAGVVLLILLGAWVGGDTGVAFFSGSLSGITLFYVKSIYVVYFIYKTETRKTEPVLSVSEAEPLNDLRHYKITGIGSNFELLNYMIEALCDGSQAMYYARYREENDGPWGRFIEDTMLFYGNYLSPLHTVKSKRSFQLIRQIALEASYLDTMERALFNYWLRAYLTGDYLSVVVPYDDDFLVKASICERSYGEELEIKEILGKSSFLLLMDSVTAFTEPVIDVYTDWSIDELKEHITRVHPVD